MVVAAEVGREQVLRVAAVWGTTIMDMRLLSRGESYELGTEGSPASAIPASFAVAPTPLRAVAGGWELDARGAMNGLLKLRGRDEDAIALSKSGAPIPVVPGDYGLVQYGLFSIFFQYTSRQNALGGKTNAETLVTLSLISSVVLHLGAIGLVRALMTPPPLDKPPELAGGNDNSTLFKMVRAANEEPPPPIMAEQSDKGGGSGVKDPGAKDTKPQGSNAKAAGAEGKFGMNGKADHSEAPGDPHQLPASNPFDQADVQELNRTFAAIGSVANALGGLNSDNIVFGQNSGRGLQGVGSGGGGDSTTTFGSGTLNTGLGWGTGNGMGTGSGGFGGAGRGGFGRGGSGGGNGTGNGSGDGNGNGDGPGEHGVNGGGAMAAKGGLSPEQVRRVVMAHIGALRACYEVEAQKNPKLKGSVTVAWTIDSSGGVAGAAVAGTTLGNARVEGCVVRQVRGWRFPASDGSTSTSFPFAFAL
jgi:hypothetical protein